MSIMESMGKKKPRPRRSFTDEFKAEIVELCQRGDRSVGQVARDFDLTETAVREWVKQAERDAGTRDDGGLTTAEQGELDVRVEPRGLERPHPGRFLVVAREDVADVVDHAREADENRPDRHPAQRVGILREGRRREHGQRGGGAPGEHDRARACEEGRQPATPPDQPSRAPGAAAGGSDRSPEAHATPTPS